jgi:hypothetical protein
LESNTQNGKMWNMCTFSCTSVQGTVCDNCQICYGYNWAIFMVDEFNVLQCDVMATCCLILLMSLMVVILIMMIWL